MECEGKIIIYVCNKRERVSIFYTVTPPIGDFRTYTKQFWIYLGATSTYLQLRFGNFFLPLLYKLTNNSWIHTPSVVVVVTDTQAYYYIDYECRSYCTLYLAQISRVLCLVITSYKHPDLSLTLSLLFFSTHLELSFHLLRATLVHKLYLQ